VARMEEGRGVHSVLMGKTEGKGPLGRPRRRWEDDIKMDLQEVGRGYGEWMKLAQGRGMSWAGNVARMKEERGVHKVLVGKSEERRPLGRPRRRWEDNIKMDLQEVRHGRSRCVHHKHHYHQSRSHEW
jgi:hypothetical protein